MYDSKSDTLDEFRYQIGIYGEKIKETGVLLEKVTKLITTEKYIYRNVSYYTCERNGFYLLCRAGVDPQPETFPFGDNELSLCAIRGTNQMVNKERGIDIYIPCYEKHHLLGILWVSSHHQEVNEEDCIFLTEVLAYLKRRIKERGEIGKLK